MSEVHSACRRVILYFVSWASVPVVTQGRVKPVMGCLLGQFGHCPIGGEESVCVRVSESVCTRGSEAYTCVVDRVG